MRYVVGLCVVLITVGALALLVGTGVDTPEGEPVSDAELVHVTGNDALWPHTSRTRASSGRTLAINLLVLDEPDAVVDSLERSNDTDVRPTNESIDEANVSVDTGLEEVHLVWQAAHGGTRYTYVRVDGVGEWVDEHSQLHAGTYLGTRDHVRLFAPSGSPEWTALQVHREYWDWFRLRHTVTDVGQSRDRFQADLADGSYRIADRVEAVEGTQGGTTVLEPAALIGVLVALSVGRRGIVDRTGRALAARIDRSALLLGTFVVLVPLAVRLLGIVGEGVIAGLSPKLIAAPLYVVLVLGVPVGVTVLGTNVRPLRGAVIAPVAFLVAIGVDFLVLGPIVPPPAVVLDRVVLATALGVVAAGSAIQAKSGRPILVSGWALWLWGVTATLGIGPL